MKKLLVATMVASIFLSGCGGGGTEGGSGATPTPAPTPNQAPTVDAGLDVQGNEGTSLEIDGSASDSDGTISSYQWTQVLLPML